MSSLNDGTVLMDNIAIALHWQTLEVEAECAKAD